MEYDGGEAFLREKLCWVKVLGSDQTFDVGPATGLLVSYILSLLVGILCSTLPSAHTLVSLYVEWACFFLV